MNAAGFMPTPLAGSGVAQGSVFAIFGQELGPQEGGAADQLPLGTSLAGVSIQITSTAGESVQALPIFVSAGQINAIMPSEAPAGLNFVTVTRDGETSGREPIKVVAGSFGVFARPITEQGSPVAGRTAVAVAQNVRAEGGVELNSMRSTAVPGQWMVLWGSGLGPTRGMDSQTPMPEPVPTPVEVSVGQEVAEISYAGRSPCCPGVDQINFRVPEAVPVGCFVPVSVRVRGVTYSNVETISISADGTPCRNAPDSPAAGAPSRSGHGRLSRTKSGDEIRDAAEAEFLLEPQTLQAVAAPGTCLLLSETTGPADAALDAGAQLSLSGPRGGILLQRESGGYGAAAPPGPLFLGAGAYTLAGPGGADVGSFSASLTVAPAPEWELLGGEVLDRNKGFELRWTGGLGALVSATLSSGAGRLTCSAGRSGVTLMFPPAMLVNLPISNRRPRGSEVLELGAVWASPESGFSADGLDSGRLEYRDSEQRVVSLSALELASTPVTLPNGRIIQAELAITFGERQRGLMNRRELAAERGMLFQFERPGRHVFWMFGTLIPLDIIWLDSERRIVFMSTDTPPCGSPNAADCPTFGGQEVAEFVLELAGGQAEENGLKLGDRLEW